MQMRRLYFSWVVSLLLVSAQQGALLHEIGHFSRAPLTSGATLRAEPLLENATCLTCEAFAQVANPAGAPVAGAAADPAAFVPIPESGCAIVAAEVPSPRSRGPPQA